MVGGTGDTKYNNVTSRLAALYRDALAPLILSVQQRLQMYFGTEIKTDLRRLVQGDIGSAIDLAVKAVRGGVMTANESREYFLDLDPVDDENADRINMSPNNTTQERTAPTDDGTLGDEDAASRIIPFRRN